MIKRILFQSAVGTLSLLWIGCGASNSTAVNKPAVSASPSPTPAKADAAPDPREIATASNPVVPPKAPTALSSPHLVKSIRAGGKPPRIRHRKSDEKVEYSLQIAPGVANPGEATTIRLSISHVLAAHDATFGTRKPVEDASLTAYLVAPRTKKYRSWSAARQLLKVRDAGTYSAVFTSPVEGVHRLVVKGNSKSAGVIEYSVPLSFGTWPIKEDAKLPRLPKRLPKAELADKEYGKALCHLLCKKDLPFASPKASTPTYLDSAAVASMSSSQLLATVVGETRVRDLTQVQSHHILSHLRTLHQGVRDFFPKANRYLAKEFTINEHGLDRLDETARIQLTEKQATAVVLVAFKGGEKTPYPTLVPYDDRTARDEISVEDKIGYVVFLPGKSPKHYEIGFGLNPEPTYSIANIITRKKSGAADKKSLRSFRGLGSFNDARSLRRGSARYRKEILPLYLIAAELGTMYYSDEREFTAFDSEFADLDG